MLTTCPECSLQVSTKAAFCPHCGYVFKAKRINPSKARKRLPNGFGQITKISSKPLRNPYRVMIPAGKDENGRPISKLLKPKAYFATYNEAYMALTEYHKDPLKSYEIVTFEDLYKSWLEDHKERVQRPATLRQYSSSFNHLKVLHKYNIRELRSYHLREAIEKEDCSNQLKDKMKALLNMMYDYALEREMVDRNYARDLVININRESDSKIHKAYSVDEMKVLWENINEPVIYAQVLQCYTGFRPDEILQITLDNIDLRLGTIKGGMKTEAGRDRLVPIHECLMPLIKEKYKLAQKEGYKYLIYGIGRQKEKNLPIPYDAYRHVLHKRFERLGMDHHPHDGRVHFITLCKKYNVDEYAIKYVVGHQIKDVTEKVYTERELTWLKSEISKIPPGEFLGLNL